jgi:hypothetical protein
MNVAVLGASRKPERYSYMAVKMLAEVGHAVYPVHPVFRDVDGHPAFRSLPEIPDPVHTVTVYVAPEVSSTLGPDILAAHPRRVIFNPGAENADLARDLRANGIDVLNACTLVLLRTGQFGDAGIGGGGP